MDCKTIQDRIRNGLAAATTPSEWKAFGAHLARCARCRNLVEPDSASVDVDPPPELLEGVLRLTSGPVCAVAQDRLCQDFDGELDALDSELLAAHTDACGDCGPLRAALPLLNEDLHGMRELMPDRAFVGDVLGLTTDDAALPFAARVRNTWNRLVQRPRFAWEAAYVGAMLFWLVLGAPIDALSGAPERIRGVLPETVASSSALASLRENVSSLGSRAWGAASEAWSSSRARIETGIDAQAHRAEKALVGAQQHGAELRDALRALDVGESGRAVKNLTNDAREAVSKFVTEDNHEQE